MKNYKQGLTNMATTEQEFEEDEIGIKMPAFVLCMSPSYKQKVLDKYNISSEFFMMQGGTYEHLIAKESMQDIILESSYRLNEDFQIVLNRNPPKIYGNENLGLTIGTNIHQWNEKEFSINIKEVFSIQQGLCYILSSNINMRTAGYVFSIILKENNPNQTMKLTIVSEEDAMGILMSLWQTQPFMVPDFIFNTRTTIVDIQEKRKTKITNCNSNGSPYYKCFAKATDVAIQSSNCSVKCNPMIVKSLFDTYFNDSTTPDCIDLKDEKCIFDELQEKIPSIMPQCNGQCESKEYSGKVTETSLLGTTFPNDIGKRIDLLLMSTYQFRTSIQEYKIYDEVALIGSVGGSLGLFLGFSFYGFLSEVLDHFWKKVTKQD